MIIKQKNKKRKEVTKGHAKKNNRSQQTLKKTKIIKISKREKKKNNCGLNYSKI